MNQRITFRAIALSMSFLMFFTSLGFALDVHYCQDQLKSFSFLSKAKSCHEVAIKAKLAHCKKMAKSSNHCAKLSNKDCKKGCCDNKTIVVKSLDENYTSPAVPTLDNIQIQFLVAFVYSFYNKTAIDSNYPKYINYKPPIPDKDIPVLYQSFLI